MVLFICQSGRRDSSWAVCLSTHQRLIRSVRTCTTPPVKWGPLAAGRLSHMPPEDDPPADFEDNRYVHYAALGQPQDVGAFITALQGRLRTSLDRFEQALAGAARAGCQFRHRLAPATQISRRRSASRKLTSTHSSYGMRSTRPWSSTTAARHCSGTIRPAAPSRPGRRTPLLQRLLQVQPEQVDRSITGR